MARYQVVTPLVTANTYDDGVLSVKYVYENGFLPNNVDEDQLKMLVDTEMVKEVKEDGTVEKGKSVDARPDVTAPRSEWNDYAVRSGMDRAEAEKLSFQDLRKRFQ